MAGLFGTPVRSYYSASKFALDGFGRAIQGELGGKGISVCQCYPHYVQTNVSLNALVGKGVPLGKLDDNIANGIPADEAVNDLVKAIYLKRYWVTLGPWHM